VRLIAIGCFSRKTYAEAGPAVFTRGWLAVSLRKDTNHSPARIIIAQTTGQSKSPAIIRIVLSKSITLPAALILCRLRTDSCYMKKFLEPNFVIDFVLKEKNTCSLLHKRIVKPKRHESSQNKCVSFNYIFVNKHFDNTTTNRFVR